MKELIDKLSLGIIDYEIPAAAADLDSIERSMMPEELYEGNFQIINRGKGKLKGIIYSSDRHVKMKTKVFSGDKSIIRYVIDTRCLEEGTQINGNICIVSNGGELYIPFSVKVHTKSVNTSLGEMRNMFHFADLVQKDYDEALKLFCSSCFADVFLKDDYPLRAKYEALVPGADKNIALDEFLIAANKKKAVNITASQEEKFYDNPLEDYEDTIIVQKDNWGYIRADIKSEGVFLRLDKKSITGRDFTGNICELSYVIDAGCLHEGYNYGSVTIKSLRSEIKIPVRVYKKHADGSRIRGSSYISLKKHFVELYQCYLDFRMKYITMESWAELSLGVIGEMRKLSEEDMFLQLVQAQIMIAQKKDVEAKLILDEASRKLEGMYTKNVEHYCYYLYVRAIREHSGEYTGKALEIIRSYYEHGYDSWRLLWLIMYLDDNYDRNESLKMIRIKEQYDRGMRSPLMYCETLMVLNEIPSLLRVLDDYEKSVILFGIDRQYISPKLAERILDLCETEKSFDREVFQILTGLYEISGNTRILPEIVGMLIKGAKTDRKYFCWYERAVEQGLKITGLYEYYMYAISFDYEGRIPDVILMYFVYNLTLKGERLDFLYKKVIDYKDEIPNIYQIYIRIIEKYAGECILEGRINDKLAVIYKEVFRRAVPAPETSDKLPDIINTYMIVCNNPEIREAVVIHKECKREARTPFVGGKAYVRIYSEDAAVVFADMNGNRYMHTVNYQLKKLVSQEEMLKMCYEMQPDNLGLLIYFNDKYFRYRKYQDKAVEVMEKLIMTNDIREEYRLFLEKEIIEYYSINSKEGDFIQYLENMKVDRLSARSRVRVVQLSIMRGLYEQGFRMMSRYGSDYIDSKLVLKCVDKMLQQSGDVENEDLVYFSFDAFRRGKYNENTLNYISRYYYGSTQDMYHIWQAVKNFQCESRELEEKIIVQMLFTGEYSNHIGSVFESYISNGASCKVKRAYLIRKSYDYFVKETIIDHKVFDHIENELGNKEDVHYICELAWLKFQSEHENLSHEKAALCRAILYEMCGRNKKFEFYKKFSRYFPLPQSVENKTILEYRTLPDSEVYVHYVIDGGTGDYKTEKMTNSCQGIFTHEFILFYGETIKYYITEEKQGVTNATESRELTLSRDHVWTDDSPYGILNNMMICSEMHEEQTLNELAVDYYVRKKLNESIFMTM